MYVEVVTNPERRRIEPRLLELVTTFSEPITVARRLSFTTSRVALLHCGTPMPVLELLAQLKFPTYDPRFFFPFWVDGDPSNEVLSNVDLAKKANVPDVLVKGRRGGRP